MNILIQIEPKFVGPFSVGTVTLIKTLQRSLGLGLAEATAWVDRCVFDGEIVSIPVSGNIDAQMVIEEIQKVEGPAKILVWIE